MVSLQGFTEYVLKENVDVIDAKKQVREILKQKRATNKKGLLICFEGIDGVGKSYGRGTPVLMYDGSIKPIEQIVIGDLVMGDDSTARKVISLDHGWDRMYKIIPKKGTPHNINSRHELVFQFAGNKNNFSDQLQDDGFVHMTGPEFMRRSECFRRYANLVRRSVFFQEQSVRIDPYILGVWLGDGTSACSQITNADRLIVEAIYAEATHRNLSIHITSKGSGKALRYSLRGVRGKTGSNSFLNDLRYYNLINNKHVPLAYKANSKEIRMAILAGLIDTDGDLSANGCLCFTNKNKQLAEDVAYLARSLGMAAYIKECRKECCNTKIWGTYYRVTISGTCSEVPTRLPHKQATIRTINKNPLKVGFHVEEGIYEEYFGFETDGNHLFLLGDFTVVHNTTQVDKLMDYLDGSGYEVIHTKWNSSSLLKKPIKKAKEKHMLTPILYSLLHAADMVVRYENEIVPALNANKVVVSDRYIYTSMARDSARGVDMGILEKIYSDIRQPDILFHCVLPIHRAFHRLVKEKDLTYYGVGMDLNLADNMEDSYIKYENLVDKAYRRITPQGVFLRSARYGQEHRGNCSGSPESRQGKNRHRQIQEGLKYGGIRRST